MLSQLLCHFSSLDSIFLSLSFLLLCFPFFFNLISSPLFIFPKNLSINADVLLKKKYHCPFHANQDLWHGRAPVFQSCLLSTHLLDASHFFLLRLRSKSSQVMQRRVFPISRQFPPLCTLPTSSLAFGGDGSDETVSLSLITIHSERWCVIHEEKCLGK